jgi:hypothetical protein
VQDAIELYTAAFCSLEEPPGVAEFPDVKPHAQDAAYVAAGSMGSILSTDPDQPTDLTRLRAWS